MNKAEAVKHLHNLIQRIEIVRSKASSSPDYTKWKRDVETAIAYIFDKNSPNLKDFKNINFSPWIISSDTTQTEFDRAFNRGLDNTKAVLESMIEEINNFWPDDNTNTDAKSYEKVAFTSVESPSITMKIPLKYPIILFYSYAQEDESYRIELEKHLKLLNRQGIISEWHFRMITGGAEWKGEIDNHLNIAKIILLLISSDFISSDYCYDIEMKKAMKMHERKIAHVIPVILRPVDWHSSLFGKLQALPKDGKPISTWPNHDEAFLDITKGIKNVIHELTQPNNPAIKSTTPTFKEPKNVVNPLSTNIFCINCGVKIGKQSECIEISGHSYKSFNGSVYCTKCGVQAGGQSQCNDIYGHDFKSIAND
jgi:hypothetical protein